MSSFDFSINGLASQIDTHPRTVVLALLGGIVCLLGWIIKLLISSKRLNVARRSSFASATPFHEPRKLFERSKSASARNISVIDSIAKGELHDTLQINKYDTAECVSFMPIIGHCLSHIPKQLSSMQRRLTDIYFKRILSDKYLFQAWMLYLSSTNDIECVRLWDQYNIYYKNKKQGKNSTNNRNMSTQQRKIYDDNILKVNKYLSFNKSNCHGLDRSSIMFFQTVYKQMIDIYNNKNKNKGSKTPKRSSFSLINRRMSNDNSNNNSNSNGLDNQGTNSDGGKNGSAFEENEDAAFDRGIIKLLKEKEIFDLTNGNRLYYVKFRSVFVSENQPLLLDCYTITKSFFNSIEYLNDNQKYLPQLSGSSLRNNVKNGKNGENASDASNHKSGESGQSSDTISKHMCLSSIILLKMGDDLRKDLAVMNTFRFINYIWRKHELTVSDPSHIHVTQQYFVQRLIYSVIPITEDFGGIEYIYGCDKLDNIYDVLAQSPSIQKHDININYKLISTGVASFISSFVIGARDRHNDNILVRSDGTIFDIDFNFILGETVTGLDASRLAISDKFVKYLGENGWRKFIQVACDAYMLLREYYVEISDFMQIAFDFLNNPQMIDDYLRQALKIEFSKIEAETYISDKLKNSPSKWKTKLKNRVHNIAQGIKKL